MNKRALSKLMHARVIGLLSSGPYFFRGDFEYVLNGVDFEYVPRGLYIWKFRFPLFDSFGPHLSYSTRLSERAGFIGKGEMSDESIVDFIMSSPEAKETFGSEKSAEVPEFIRFLESKPDDVQRLDYVRIVYASALVLVGQDSRAASILDELAPVLDGKSAAICDRLRTSLRQGPASARKLLDQVRRENLQFLGVEQ